MRSRRTIADEGVVRVRRLDRIWTRPTWIALLVAVGYALVVLVAAATLPVYGWSSQSVTAVGEPPAATVTGTATLLQVNGWRGLLVVCVPLVVTLAVGGLLVRSTGWIGVAVASAVTLVLLGLCVLALLSIGLFVAPLALVLVVACATSRVDWPTSTVPVAA